MASSIGAYLVAQRGGWQRRYIDYRVLAEALRVQFYWAIAGVERPAASRFGHDAFLKRQDLELGWIRNMLRVAGQQGRCDRRDALRIRRRDRGARLGREYELSYYRERGRSCSKWHRFTEVLDRTSFAAGLLLAGWLALAQLLFERQPTNLLFALMGFLPSSRRCCASTMRCEPQKASRSLQYQFMERIFRNAQRQLLAHDQRVRTAADPARIGRRGAARKRPVDSAPARAADIDVVER